MHLSLPKKTKSSEQWGIKDSNLAPAALSVRPGPSTSPSIAESKPQCIPMFLPISPCMEVSQSYQSAGSDLRFKVSTVRPSKLLSLKSYHKAKGGNNCKHSFFSLQAPSLDGLHSNGPYIGRVRFSPPATRLDCCIFLASSSKISMTPNRNQEGNPAENADSIRAHPDGVKKLSSGNFKWWCGATKMR